ncbi:MAG: endopeptidase La [Spirochaetaceae bacterium]
MDKNDIIQDETKLPEQLPIIPLQGKPIFPGIFSPILIVSQEDITVVENAMNADKLIGLLLLIDDNEDDISPDNLFNVGTVAKIVKKVNLPDGGINIFISTIKRFEVTSFFIDEDPLIASVKYVEEIVEQSMEVKALTRSLISDMKQITDDNHILSEEVRLNMVNIDEPGKIADFIASILNIDRLQQQQILGTFDIRDRLEQVLIYIKKEQDLLRIQKKISKQINEKIEKNQKEYFLREEIKAIKKELGEPADGKTSDVIKFKEAISKLNLVDEAKEQVDSELEKFSLMDPSSSEFFVTRNYLETVIGMPWNDPKMDNIDLLKGQKILDKDHYGLDDVKERIIEYLAVRKLKNDTKGSIICLVGPPGVGKTSIGKSIARSMGRNFFRFSVGGMRDESEIKGHRRTYIGSMPGKIIQGLKIVKTKAPVFMIDEIDKLSTSAMGDPSSALLEVLDPEQNIAFRDHYLDLPFDLSHVLFIATANSLDTIPKPLLDRMEIIRLSGYILDEKTEIAKKYIIPKSLKKHGLEKSQVKFPASTLKAIGEGYARDAGMRTFEQALDKINRKIAKKIVMGEANLPITITTDNLEEFLKKPFFRDEEIKKVTAPGMAIGLAWTNYGGDTLIIETVKTTGKAALQLTGQLGDVMKESATLAFTYVKSIASEYGIDDKFFETNTVNLHIPEGATPKDGPSAGITMATTFLSLAKNKQIKKGFAMTGELSLTGKVLPIGGLKEKVIAARRNKIKHIIIPIQNERDIDEIPDKVKKGITFYPVTFMTEVIDILL